MRMEDEVSNLASEIYDFVDYLIEDGADPELALSALVAVVVHITQERDEAEAQAKALLDDVLSGRGRLQ